MKKSILNIILLLIDYSHGYYDAVLRPRQFVPESDVTVSSLTVCRSELVRNRIKWLLTCSKTGQSHTHANHSPEATQVYLGSL